MRPERAAVWPRARPGMADGLFAALVGLVLGVPSVVIAWLSVDHTRALLMLAGAAVAHVALGWRRSRPLASGAVTGGAVIVNQAKGGQYLDPSAGARVRDVLRSIEDTSRSSLTEPRGLVGLLGEDSADRQPRPGLARLPELVDRVRDTGRAVTLAEVGPRGALGPGGELAVFRIVQESPRILVLTTFDLDEYAFAALAAGRAASSSRTPRRRTCCGPSEPCTPVTPLSRRPPPAVWSLMCPGHCGRMPTMSPPA